MTPEQQAAEAEAWFNARHVRLRTYRKGGEYWTDLLGKKNRRFKAVRYGRGETREAAVLRAKRRWVEEQGPE